jgi:hypothetical protein
MANGSYLQSEDGLKARKREIEDIEEHFNEMVNNILDPEPEIDLSANPFFAKAESGLDRLRWELMGQGQM